MRTKNEILEATHRHALKGSGPLDVALIHSLHKLEVQIDIRDLLQGVFNRLADIAEALQDKH